MALILHIETATGICSVGVSRAGTLLSLQSTTEGYQHASRITLLIEACMQEAACQLAGLDAVSLSSGPGSYTSLRVGTATAKGICYSLDKPLIIVDTLQALALATLQREKEEALYFPMIDARRMEVYTAGFDAANERIEPPQALIVEPDSFHSLLEAGNTIVLSGDGAEKCRKVLPESSFLFSPIRCSAAYLIPLALAAFEQENFADLAYYSPFYLKSPNITKPKKLL